MSAAGPAPDWQTSKALSRPPQGCAWYIKAVCGATHRLAVCVAAGVVAAAHSLAAARTGHTSGRTQPCGQALCARLPEHGAGESWPGAGKAKVDGRRQGLACTALVVARFRRSCQPLSQVALVIALVVAPAPWRRLPRSSRYEGTGMPATWALTG